MNFDKPLALCMAEFAVSLDENTVSEQVKSLAKASLLDAFGCMLAGFNESAAVIAREYVELQGKSDDALIYGTDGLHASCADAAFANGVAMAVHEYDDINNTSMGHPSAPVLPVVLALGEKYGCSGEEALIAYITGIEIYSLVGRLVSPEHNKCGWNSSGSLGIFGAAAAAAKILKLDAQKTAAALAIAASDASGLKGNSGTMTKPAHSARAAQKGIYAAEMAKLGFTANLAIFETKGGFADVTAGSALHYEALLKAIDERHSEFIDMGMTMKPWPSCRATHNGIDAALILRSKYNICPQNIRNVSVKVLPGMHEIIRYAVVDDPTKGKFSLHYCVAAALIRGKLSMADFEGEKIDDPELSALMARIEVVTDDSGIYFDKHGKTVVTIQMNTGECFEQTVVHAKGEPENPMSEEEQKEKFSDCVSRITCAESAEPIANIVKDFSNYLSVKEFAKKINALL